MISVNKHYRKHHRGVICFLSDGKCPIYGGLLRYYKVYVTKFHKNNHYLSYQDICGMTILSKTFKCLYVKKGFETSERKHSSNDIIVDPLKSPNLKF